MIRIENEALAPVPPSRVWEVLTAFDRYPRWHPFIRLRGEAVLGAEIDYLYTLKFPSKQKWKAFAKIIELAPMQSFSWRIGVRYLFIAKEGYVLDDQSGGTKIRHWLEYSGIASWPFARGMSRRAESMMKEADEALRAHVIKEQRARSQKVLRHHAGRKPRS
jgi:hypothetical protein